MLKVLTDEASKGYEKKKMDTGGSKIMHKYAQMKRFCHDQRLQFYIYGFIYDYPQTMPVEGHFTYTKKKVVNYKRI